MCLQQDSTAQVSLITSLHAHVFPSGFLGHSNVPCSSKFMIMLLMGLGKRRKKDGTKWINTMVGKEWERLKRSRERSNGKV